jgi:hypothetical protein
VPQEGHKNIFHQYERNTNALAGCNRGLGGTFLGEVERKSRLGDCGGGDQQGDPSHASATEAWTEQPNCTSLIQAACNPG